MRLRLLKMPAGDELAFVREQIDHLAVGWLALEAIHGGIPHPRMAAVEGAGFSWFQDDFSQYDLPYKVSNVTDRRNSRK